MSALLIGIPEMHPEKLGAGAAPSKSPTKSGQAGQAGGTGAAPTQKGGHAAESKMATSRPGRDKCRRRYKNKMARRRRNQKPIGENQLDKAGNPVGIKSLIFLALLTAATGFAAVGALMVSLTG